MIVHGSVYRVIVKLVSICLHIGTDVVRGNFVLTLRYFFMSYSYISAERQTIIKRNWRDTYVQP